MSYLSSDYVQCETIQSILDDNFVNCSAATLDSMPFLEAVTSTQMAMGVAQKVSDGNGKVKTVSLIYDRRLVETDVSDSSGTRTCTSSTERYNAYQTYTIDSTQWLRAEDKITTAELATVCSDDVPSLMAKKIGQLVDVLERKIATQTAEEVVGMIGQWNDAVGNVNGSSELELATLVSAATKQLDPFMWGNLNIALNQTGYCAPPIIVGGADMYLGAQAFDSGCCSDTGVDIMNITNKLGKAVMYDKRVAKALGTGGNFANNKSVVFQAGSLALITYNESPQIQMIGGDYNKFKVNSPRTGLPIDIILKDDCGVISIVGYANTKLVGLPADMFANSDDYHGVTYVNKVKVVNPA